MLGVKVGHVIEELVLFKAALGHHDSTLLGDAGGELVPPLAALIDAFELRRHRLHTVRVLFPLTILFLTFGEDGVPFALHLDPLLVDHPHEGLQEVVP